jgi:hypothetical protein
MCRKKLSQFTTGNPLKSKKPPAKVEKSFKLTIWPCPRKAFPRLFRIFLAADSSGFGEGEA